MADEKISAMPNAAALTGAELVPVVQGGSNVKATTQNIANLAPAVPAGANPSATGGPAAINGSSAHFMRADASPAIQTATNLQQGLVQGDGVTTTVSGGVISTTTAINAQTGTTYTVVPADSGRVITFSNASPIAVTLPQAGSAGFAANWGTTFVNKGAGRVTITTTTSLFNGRSSTLILDEGGSASVVSDGADWPSVLAPLFDYEEGSWTPTDNSGAGLSLTNNGSFYRKVGSLVWLSWNVTYPATGSGSEASLAGLPFTIKTNVGFIADCWGSVLGAVALAGAATGNYAAFEFHNFSTGANITNATLSGGQIFGSTVYGV